MKEEIGNEIDKSANENQLNLYENYSFIFLFESIFI